MVRYTSRSLTTNNENTTQRKRSKPSSPSLRRRPPRRRGGWFTINIRVTVWLLALTGGGIVLIETIGYSARSSSSSGSGLVDETKGENVGSIRSDRSDSGGNDSHVDGGDSGDREGTDEKKKGHGIHVTVRKNRVQELIEANSHMDEEEEEENEPAKTGAMANCDPTDDRPQPKSEAVPHRDSGTLTAYCHTIHYRAAVETFSSLFSRRLNGDGDGGDAGDERTVPPVLIGVLSAAGGSGPSRRQTIRETWGSFSYSNGGTRDDGERPPPSSLPPPVRSQVFFIVAGPWSDVSEEYATHGDLIWIDKEEVYQGEDSVLTYKTASFLSIVYRITDGLVAGGDGNRDDDDLNVDGEGDGANGIGLTSRPADYTVFKTDDDCYLDITRLTQLNDFIPSEHHPEPWDYWGFCRAKQPSPLRGPDDKWAVSYETYPESVFPRYCQGAGFGISSRFVSCAAASLDSLLLFGDDSNHGEEGEGDEGEEKEGEEEEEEDEAAKEDNKTIPNNSHIARSRFMPFEDVAVGLLAERCGIVPTMIPDPDSFRMYRGSGGKEERDRVNTGGAKDGVQALRLPTPDWSGSVILQHRIDSDEDMREFHRAAMDPEGYWRKNARVEELEEYYGKEEKEGRE